MELLRDCGRKRRFFFWPETPIGELASAYTILAEGKVPTHTLYSSLPTVGGKNLFYSDRYNFLNFENVNTSSRRKIISSAPRCTM